MSFTSTSTSTSSLHSSHFYPPSFAPPPPLPPPLPASHLFSSQCQVVPPSALRVFRHPLPLPPLPSLPLHPSLPSSSFPSSPPPSRHFHAPLYCPLPLPPPPSSPLSHPLTLSARTTYSPSDTSTRHLSTPFHWRTPYSDRNAPLFTSLHSSPPFLSPSSPSFPSSFSSSSSSFSSPFSSPSLSSSSSPSSSSSSFSNAFVPSAFVAPLSASRSDEQRCIERDTQLINLASQETTLLAEVAEWRMNLDSCMVPLSSGITEKPRKQSLAQRLFSAASLRGDKKDVFLLRLVEIEQNRLRVLYNGPKELKESSELVEDCMSPSCIEQLISYVILNADTRSRLLHYLDLLQQQVKLINTRSHKRPVRNEIEKVLSAPKTRYALLTLLLINLHDEDVLGALLSIVAGWLSLPQQEQSITRIWSERDLSAVLQCATMHWLHSDSSTVLLPAAHVMRALAMSDEVVQKRIIDAGMLAVAESLLDCTIVDVTGVFARYVLSSIAVFVRYSPIDDLKTVLPILHSICAFCARPAHQQWLQKNEKAVVSMLTALQAFSIQLSHHPELVPAEMLVLVNRTSSSWAVSYPVQSACVSIWNDLVTHGNNSTVNRSSLYQPAFLTELMTLLHIFGADNESFAVQLCTLVGKILSKRTVIESVPLQASDVLTLLSVANSLCESVSLQHSILVVLEHCLSDPYFVPPATKVKLLDFALQMIVKHVFDVKIARHASRMLLQLLFLERDLFDQDRARSAEVILKRVHNVQESVVLTNDEESALPALNALLNLLQTNASSSFNTVRSSDVMVPSFELHNSSPPLLSSSVIAAADILNFSNNDIKADLRATDVSLPSNAFGLASSNAVPHELVEKSDQEHQLENDESLLIFSDEVETTISEFTAETATDHDCAVARSNFDAFPDHVHSIPHSDVTVADMEFTAAKQDANDPILSHTDISSQPLDYDVQLPIENIAVQSPSSAESSWVETVAVTEPADINESFQQLKALDVPSCRSLLFMLAQACSNTDKGRQEATLCNLLRAFCQNEASITSIKDMPALEVIQLSSLVQSKTVEFTNHAELQTNAQNFLLLLRTYSQHMGPPSSQPSSLLKKDLVQCLNGAEKEPQAESKMPTLNERTQKSAFSKSPYSKKCIVQHS